MTSNLTRQHGLGSLAVLSDQLLIELVLSELDASSLLHCSLVSKALYVFANCDDLWRSLVFTERKRAFVYLCNWKATFLRNRSFTFATVRIENFTSEYLNFRYFMRTYDPQQLLASIRESKDIRRFNNFNTTKAILMNNNNGIDVHKVCVFTGLIQNEQWPALRNWTPENLLTKYGDSLFRIGTGIGRNMIDMRLRDYAMYCLRQQDDVPLYLFDARFIEKYSQMQNDYTPPKCFSQPDYLSVLGELRPHYRWLVIGPKRSGSSFHVDPDGTSAWNALISGIKLWVFYPPGETPPGVEFAFDNAEEEIRHSINDNNSDVDLEKPSQKFMYRNTDDEDFDSPEPLEWFLYQFPNLEGKPLILIQRAGDVVFVPNGWWHAVLNITDTVAVTQNFVSDWNLDICLAELFSDRRSLFDTFVTKLLQQYPHLETRVNAVVNELQKQEEEKLRCERFDYVTAIRDLSERHQKELQSFSFTTLSKTNNSNPNSSSSQNNDAHPIHAPRSENLVFFHQEFVFKFFDAKNSAAERSFVKEREVYQKLKTASNNTSRTNISTTNTLVSNNSFSSYWPSLFASGTYVSSASPPGTWHYLILSRITNAQCAQNVFERLCEQEKIEMARFASRSVFALHSVDVSSNINTDNSGPLSLSNWHQRLLDRYDTAVKRHERFNTLSYSLLEQIYSFLPSREKLIETLTRDRPIVLLHSDLNDQNLLGRMHNIHNSNDKERKNHILTSATSFGSSSSDVTNNNTSSNCNTTLNNDINIYHWTPCSLIDFGDAKIGDPLWDLVPLYASVFHLQQPLLREFLRTYNNLNNQNHLDDAKKLTTKNISNNNRQIEINNETIYRLMCYLLLHDSDAMSTVFHYRPELRSVNSWNELAREIWTQ